MPALPRASKVEDSLIRESLLGASDAMAEVQQQLLDAAHDDRPLLFRGEVGTGRELSARVLHAVTPGASKERFVVLNPVALPARFLPHDSDSLDELLPLS